MKVKQLNSFLIVIIGIIFLTSCQQIKHEPAASDKYRLAWNDDPTTTMTIIWDQLKDSDSRVHYGKEDFGRDFTKYPLTKEPTRKLLNTYEMNTHYAEIKNLEPDQNYYFVIKDEFGVSKRFYFKTAPDKPQAFTFIGGGDTKSFEESYLAGQASTKMVSKLSPLFVMFNGDFNSGDGTYPDRWHQWLRDWDTLTTTPQGRKIPIVAVQGNHENGDKTILNKIFNAPFQYEDSSNIFYSLSFGGGFAHLIALNSQIEVGGKQGEWLENDLENNKQSTFKVAGYHKPFRPHAAKKGKANKQYKQWAQLFYDYSLSLSLDGDAHVHKITYPLKPSVEKGSFEGFIRDDEKGTVFAGEGSWGAHPRKLTENNPWTLQLGSFNQIKWIHVKPVGESSVSFEIFTVITGTYDDDDNLTLHVDEVEALTEDDLFRVPKNIKLFNPDGRNNSVKFVLGK